MRPNVPWRCNAGYGLAGRRKLTCGDRFGDVRLVVLKQRLLDGWAPRCECLCHLTCGCQRIVFVLITQLGVDRPHADAPLRADARGRAAYRSEGFFSGRESSMKLIVALAAASLGSSLMAIIPANAQVQKKDPA